MPEISESPSGKKTRAGAAVVTKVVTKTESVSAQPVGELPDDKKPHISDWFAQQTPEDLSHTAFYLYRLNPDIKTSDGGTMLWRLTDADFAEFTDRDFWRGLQEWTAKKFGGSRYRLWVNNTKVRQTLYTREFQIEGAPILGGREGYMPGARAPVSSSVDPSMQALFSQIIKETIERLKANAMDPGQAVTQVMEVMKSVNAQTAEMLRAQIPQQKDPIETLTAMLTLVDRMEAKNAALPPVDLEAQLERTLTLLDKFGVLRRSEPAAAPGPPPNPFEVVKDTMQSIQALGFVRQGAGVPGGRPGPEAWVAPLMPYLPMILQHVTDMVDRIAAAIAARGGPSAATGQPHPSNVAVISRGPGGMAGRLAAAQPGTTAGPGVGSPRSSLIAAVHAVPPPQPATPATAAPAGPRPASASPAPYQPRASAGWSEAESSGTGPGQPAAPGEIPIDVWIRAKIVDFFQLGVEGDDVANWLQLSEPRLANLLGSLSIENLEAALRADDVLRRMAGDPRLPKFLQQFLNYFKPESE